MTAKKPAAPAPKPAKGRTAEVSAAKPAPKTAALEAKTAKAQAKTNMSSFAAITTIPVRPPIGIF